MTLMKLIIQKEKFLFVLLGSEINPPKLKEKYYQPTNLKLACFPVNNIIF